MGLSSTLAAVAFALPGFYAWWTGRSLIARVQDPLLPEQILVRRQRLGLVLWLAMTLLGVVLRWQALWAVPVQLLLFAAGGFPVRQAVFGETWSFVSYVRYAAASFVSTLGFWLTLALTPTIVLSLAPGGRWQYVVLVGTAAAIALVTWERVYATFWLRAHRASSLTNAALRRRLEDIAGRSTAPMPSVYRFGVPGSAMVNAFAFPSATHPRVAFSDVLLESLDEGEIAAIFAHEQAHHEYFSPRRCRRMRWATLVLAILAAIALPLLLVRVPYMSGWMALLFPVVVLIALAKRMQRSQHHETESDLRALALTGDAPTLIRALTKVHVFARMPRRWSHDFERAASHPSLARRIQAIEAAAGSAPATNGSPVVARGVTAGVFVVLEAERGFWLEGVAEGTPADADALRATALRYKAIAYADLVELRVISARGVPKLRATEKAGSTWEIAIDPGDVLAVQTALDRVDVRLAVRTVDRATGWLRAAAAFIALLLLSVGQLGIAGLAALLAFARPSAGAAAALGALAILKAATVLLDGPPTIWGGSVSLPMVAVALIGLAALWLARRRLSGTGTARDRTLTAVAFALVAAVFAMMVVDQGIPRVGTHLDSSPALASLGYALAAFGASLIVLPGRAPRLGGSAIVLAAIAAALVGSGLTSSLGNAAQMTWATSPVRAVASVRLPEHAMSLNLSPSAQRFAVRLANAEYDDESPIVLSTFVLGDMHGVQRRVAGQEIGFLDDSHVAVLGGNRQALRVRVVRITGDTTPVWEESLPYLIAPTLFVNRHTREWTVAGFLAGADTLLVVTGGTRAGTLRSVRLGNSGGIGQIAVARRDGSALVSRVDLTRSPLGILSILGGRAFTVRLRDLRADTRRDIARLPGFLSCSGEDHTGTTLCTTVDGTRSRVWRLTSSSELSLAAVLPRGAYRISRSESAGVAVLSGSGGDVLVLPPASSSGLRLHLAEAGSSILDAAMAPGFLGALIYERDHIQLKVYALPKAPTPGMASAPSLLP